MYIGQMGTNPWLKTSWLNRAGFQQISKNMSNTLPKEHTQQQTKSVNTDRFQLSSSYPRFPNQMKILETPEATQVNATLVAADLRPASEKAYTEEDALMNQYMKQYRLSFVKEGGFLCARPLQAGEADDRGAGQPGESGCVPC